MDRLEQIIWERDPYTDDHCVGPKSPYQERDAAGVASILRFRDLRITDFVSREALGNNIATSRELISQSRKLLAESKRQIDRIHSRSTLSHHHRVQ
jgi:hypothetical protein